LDPDLYQCEKLDPDQSEQPDPAGSVPKWGLDPEHCCRGNKTHEDTSCKKNEASYNYDENLFSEINLKKGIVSPRSPRHLTQCTYLQTQNLFSD
jgi:hypothetical protein